MNTNESPLAEWGILKNTKRPVVIAGPCSAETADQVLETARGLKAIGIEVFRAGIWKPRTRPNSFEGVGSEGLEWLKLVKSEVGMLTATEVANVKHVYEALRAGVDILWIGARTSANPFAMQEVADALKGVDIPVFVKNPVNPDVELWVGAVERVLGAGLKKVGVIHRGFSSFEKTRFRNVPQWQLPIEFRRRMPGIPMICDPSHISGCTELLQEVSQKALDLNFDGLIIESHRNPAEAWSDAKQQVTPAELDKLLKSLVLRDVEVSQSLKETLDDLRLKIDKYDDDLLKTLDARMKIAEQIGQYKKEHNITILQPTRWDEIISKIVAKGAEHNLSAEFLSTVFKAIHQESINKQNKIMNGE
ncbi:MAG: bifunctional 3-deoxy-7-phosphoheptulonate synthase/chorismate mutase type II [Salinivirgaceae bacterium]|nr:bifunctional 3-deoxy-7-phosphoheptulonate synthase/chorismate mutase type II [Salinivirgaceae bacterium]MBR5958148.1 bifunctional 3-deoxy-7-phosphoheptulonate synthase/chorismate mutase type II [Salinivirgaceae bacterium]